MIEKMSKFTVRVNEETLKKFRYVAEYNARSANRELEFLMKKHIDEFEKTHEKIVLSGL
ncbi:MAG: Arc family DNA-binding protein [Lachnospiraceae bacterium]|jgi:Arc-like DNA binding domain.|nr:Arc family DNA-binding protein [Lachnospiraceae bacterium]